MAKTGVTTFFIDDKIDTEQAIKLRNPTDEMKNAGQLHDVD
jgi:hypothetical protein